MRLIAGLVLAGAALAGLVLWGAGGFETLAWQVRQLQQGLQQALAGRILALRAGEAAAFWSLIGICAAYGFAHALGPGHGKALIAGAAMGTRLPARRMALIALAGSLAQAGFAIALVYGALGVLAATARGTVEGAGDWAAPVGNLLVALIGGWLVWRGLAALGAGRRHARGHHHHCGHAHGPDPAEVAQATTPAATLALVGAMAVRPCTGALIVLVLAWRFGLAWAGAAAAIAMGLGTAAFTVLVAFAAVGGRDAAFLAAGDGRAARLLGPALQILAGALILAISGLLTLAGPGA